MRLQVESEVVAFALGLTRQRLPTARAADRSAHSAWPAVGNGQWAMGSGQWKGPPASVREHLQKPYDTYVYPM